MENSITIFVYGSLMNGEMNFGRFGPQKKVCDAETADGYVLINFGNAYPGMVPLPSFKSVKGELHEMSHATYAMIREMELRAGYIEMPVRVYDDLQKEYETTAFLFAAYQPIVPLGNWKNVKARPSPRNS